MDGFSDSPINQNHGLFLKGEPAMSKQNLFRSTQSLPIILLLVGLIGSATPAQANILVPPTHLQPDHLPGSLSSGDWSQIQALMGEKSSLPVVLSRTAENKTSQQAYLKPSNTDMGDEFGSLVAVSGDTVVVGAPYESSSATGVNGNQNDNSAAYSGAAYVFVRSGSSWSQQAYLKASNTDASDYFGETVAVSGDTIVVGASFEASNAIGVNGNQNDDSAARAGAAYVFVRSGTTWSQQAYLKASNTESGDSFGNSVAISGDTIVIGAELEDSSATGVNGDQTNNLASFAGAAYVFVRSGGTWNQQAYLKASNTDTDPNARDAFGCSVAVSGDTIVIGAHREDSDAIGVNGDQTNNDLPESGAAYVFVRSAGTWNQQAYLKASNTDGGDFYGNAVAVSGDTVVVGAWYEDSNATGVNGDQTNNLAAMSGAAYVYVRSGGSWSQQAYLKASNTDAADNFAYSVSISGDRIVVGAFDEDSNATGVYGNQNDNSADHSGAAYLFTRSGGSWSQLFYIKPSNTNAADLFGHSVAISGETFISGARHEASNATGVNGNQNDNSATNAGAAYVFTVSDVIELYVPWVVRR
jgi:hypothetical protein